MVQYLLFLKFWLFVVFPFSLQYPNFQYGFIKGSTSLDQHKESFHNQIKIFFFFWVFGKTLVKIISQVICSSSLQCFQSHGLPVSITISRMRSPWTVNSRSISGPVMQISTRLLILVLKIGSTKISPKQGSRKFMLLKQVVENVNCTKLQERIQAAPIGDPISRWVQLRRKRRICLLDSRK